jgi:Fe(3+) dicitrate transport protein
VSAFSLFYENRIGSIVNYDSLGGYHTLKTNIGNSISQGVEFYLERMFNLGKNCSVNLHTATSYTNAKYLDASITSGPYDVDISGNQVESVPNIISRNGVKFSSKDIDLSITYSYTAESYSDALNTVKPDAAGAIGKVPAYSVLDCSAQYKLKDNLTFGLAVNNFMNEKYYTKRPQMYPGPGIWPSDGRSITFTVKLNY